MFCQSLTDFTDFITYYKVGLPNYQKVTFSHRHDCATDVSEFNGHHGLEPRTAVALVSKLGREIPELWSSFSGWTWRSLLHCIFKNNVEKRQLHATTLGWLSGCRCPWNFNLKLNSTCRICVLHLLVVECTLSIMHASEELRPNWTSGPRFGFPQFWKHMLLVNVDDTCLTNWKTYIIDNTAVLLICDAGSSWRNNAERLTKLKLETQRIFFQLALR